MEQPPVSGDEPARLAALADHEFEETADDAALDQLAQAAARLIGARTGLVTLITEREQIFLGRANMPWRTTSREVAFCPHAMARGELMEVPDAAEDARFAANSLVTGPPYIRFYAGAPLTTQEGYHLGTLCVLDDRPGQLTEAQRTGLREMAGAAARILADRRRILHHARECEAARAFNAHVIAATPLLVIGLTPQGETVFANPAAEAATGYAADELIGADWWKLVYPGRYGEQVAPFRRALAEHGDVTEYDMTLVTRGGEERAIAWTTLNQRDGDGTLTRIVAMGRDVTEAKRRQRVREQQQRLEALGQMASGMAHELNNALQPTLGLLGVMREAVQNDAATVRALDVAEHHAKHARHIVGEVLAFVRGTEDATGPVDAAEALTEAAAFAAEFLPASVRLRCSGFGGDLPARVEAATPALAVPDAAAQGAALVVDINRGQLAQIVSNLAINAVHAMAGAGTLTLSLDSEMLPPDAAGASGLAPGLYAVMRVTDTGHGMDEAMQRRVLQPFYTTKTEGGSGLGLAVVHGIVQSWGGRFTIDSAPGAGTTMTIHVPARAAPVADG